MRYLIIIPARGGSKGIPEKNIRLLNDKPLIYYTIDAARAIAENKDICVTTDDDKIIECVEKYGLNVPFKRPPELASDTAGMYDTLLHTLNYYENNGKFYDAVILLQPTSPFRNGDHIKDAISLYRDSIEMVVSVKETSSNPYYLLFEEDPDGYLVKSKSGNFERRQDCPKVWEYNGAIYVINIQALKKTPLHKLKKIKKYVMEDTASIDIDNELDWLLAEMIISNKGI